MPGSVICFCVAMSEPTGALRCGQSLGDLSRIIDRLAQSDCALIHLLTQLFADEQFGHYVGPGLMRASVINRKDVGMVERGGGAGLLLEAAQSVSIFCEFSRQ